MTRWESYPSEGRMRLSQRLIHSPLSVVDYVAPHEISHWREMNHGQRF
ncbi:YgjP-like metallopeptidase domain-containing protein [Paraburkholderia sp.]